MNNRQLEPKLKDIPEIPRKFGDDGGHFYGYYDAIADEHDEDMIKSLKTQLDGIVIFAGLFAAVNSAFLVLTIPKLSPDPADDTIALLLQLVIGGNSSFASAADLPSATYTPPYEVVMVNLLFSLSLALAIAASFFAIMGQQWVVLYRKRNGAGVEHQRWEQLRRHFGAKHWHLEPILNDIIPGLLQIGLVIFSIVFLRFIDDEIIYYMFGAFMELAMAIILMISFVASCDPWCPFKGPLSHLLHVLYKFTWKRWILLFFAICLVGSICMFGLLLGGIFGITGGCLSFAFVGLLVIRIIQKRRASARMQDASQKTEDLSFGQDILWMASATTKRFLASLIPRQEDTAYLEAVATKRVLCTSEDFNALIYTAVNIQAFREKKSAIYLLQDGAAFRRLLELGRSPDQMLASAFSRAFSHLLLGGQSAKLFVGHDDRHLYEAEAFPNTDQYYGEPHPLQRAVRFICAQLKASVESSAINPDHSVGSLFYFELLELILDEASDNQRFSQWLDRVIERSPPLKVATPLVIWLVAETVRILNVKITSAAVPLRPQRPQLGLGPEQAETEDQVEEQERQNFFTVQQTRVGVVKDLISQLFPYPRRSILAGIKAAFGDRASSSPQCSDKPKLWLLEQALLIATQNLDKKSTVDLLCSFDTRAEPPKPDPTCHRDDQKDNHLHCTKILSHCLQDMQANGEADYILRSIAPTLDKLAGHLERFVNVITETPDLYHVSLLSRWLKIRDTLGETLLDPDQLSQSDEAANVYSRLRRAFGAIELAISKILNVDGNPADPPRPQAASLEVEQTGSNNAVTGRIAADSDGSNKPIHHPTGDEWEGEEHGDAQDVGPLQGAGMSDQHQRAGDDD
ncbi:hypothetical protein FRC01_004758 [Tulasnella sp. 417]|nr:hypothetical protein FRC01_004758 [Tulasnella sp. 417]